MSHLIKRKLTTQEIDDILSFIKPQKGLPEEIAICVQSKQKNDYFKQLKDIEIYPSKIPAIKEKLEILYNKSLVEAGKSVGAISSSSIGEQNTQQSLSSFHTAGQNKVQLTTGVPRNEELLNVTRDIKTPCMEITILGNTQDLKYVRQIGLQMFEYKELIEFLDDYEIIQNRKLSESETIWYNMFDMFYHTEYKECDFSVRLTFKVDKLFEYRKSLNNFAEILETNYSDLYCVYSPDNIGIIDAYVRTETIGDIEDVITSIKQTKKKGKKTDEDQDTNLLFINNENKDYIYIRDIVIPSILYTHISGIEHIKKCYYQQDKNKNWVITTKGSNLREMVKHPLVDASKLTTNHLWDVYEVFGIQAARNFLRSEFQKLLSVSGRHLDLLINAMTHSGKPQAVTRYGIDRKQVGALAKVAFEQPFDNFFHSATTAEKEDMKGNSSAITVGRASAMGSGYTQLVDKHTKKLIKEDELVYNYQKKFEDLEAQRQEKIREQIKQRQLSQSLISQPSFFQNKPLATLISPPIITKTSGTSFGATNKGKPLKLSAPVKVTQPQSEKEPTNVTRLILNKKKTEPELQLLKNAPTIVFESFDGNVVERNPEDKSKTEIDIESY
jgi:DNA-directed RNA polymerase beta' subunit